MFAILGWRIRYPAAKLCDSGAMSYNMSRIALQNRSTRPVGHRKVQPMSSATLLPRQISRRVALTALRQASERWKLPHKYWSAILHKSDSTIFGWYRELDRGSEPDSPLDADVAERISHLLSIYVGLHQLFGDAPFADEWMNRPNRAFGEVAPIDLIKTGRFEDLWKVRSYVDRANAQ